MGELFTKLFQFLLDLFNFIIVSALNLLIDLINAIILLVAGVLGTAIAVLPSPSFDFTPPASLVCLSSSINWFFPVDTVFSCFGIIAVSYIGYFSIRPILKFFQMT